MEASSQTVGADAADQFRVLLAQLERHHEAALAAAAEENATLKGKLEASELEKKWLQVAGTAMRNGPHEEVEEVEVFHRTLQPDEEVANRVKTMTARIDLASRRVSMRSPSPRFRLSSRSAPSFSETALGGETNENIEIYDPVMPRGISGGRSSGVSDKRSASASGTRSASGLDKRSSFVLERKTSTIFGGRSSGALAKAVADRHSTKIRKQQQHLRKLLDLRGNVVTAHNIMKVLQKRGRDDFSMEQAKMVVEELGELRAVTERDICIVGNTRGLSSAIELESFVQLMNLPELPSEVHVSHEVLELRRIIQTPDLDDVLDTVTKHRENLYTESSLPPLEPKQKMLLALMNAVVCLCVVTSTITLGVSLDLTPTWTGGWFPVEFAYGAVFVAEVILKIRLLGLRRYFWGPGWRWNWFDSGVTAITTLDLTLNFALGGSIEGLQVTIVLRTFRMARIARLVKLLHTPILAELANMLAGFQVGIPCLLWVMVLLFLVFYVLGIVLRQIMGPPPGVSYMANCGHTGDEAVGEGLELQCQPHILYGEEFFGRLFTSMFTTFRCVLGDCTTEGGKSLTAAFSRGYGILFDLTYSGGTVIIVIGLFNIIAAIFVETTISGLKYNNVQRKYAHAYESRYVRDRLEALVARVNELQSEAGYSHIRRDTGEFALNEDEFDEVMRDDRVSGILEDLDVAVSNRIGLYELFDCDNNGLVSISELVGTLMKIRGEPQKSDIIASWVALRSLNDQFQEFERLVLENQKTLLDCTRALLAK